jgi:hypothetical protein
LRKVEPEAGPYWPTAQAIRVRRLLVPVFAKIDLRWSWIVFSDTNIL